MRVHNAGKAHPAACELFDNLYVGEQVEAETTIGFGDGGAEDTQDFELVNEVNRIGIIMFEFAGGRYNFTLYKTLDFSNHSLSLCIKRCFHEKYSSLISPAQTAIGMLQEERFESTGLCGEVFVFAMDQPPLANNGESLHVQDYQAVCLQFHINRHARDQSDTEAYRDHLFNVAVLTKLHTPLQCKARIFQRLFQGSATS